MAMPKGKYWIGDLCYVMHGEWTEVCDLMFKGDVYDGEFNLADGRRFAAMSTAFGDGCYNTSESTALGVDAGLIGCILLDDIDMENPENDVNLGMIVEFTENFEVRGGRFTNKDWDGIIEFGHVAVYTGYDEDEEDDSMD